MELPGPAGRQRRHPPGRVQKRKSVGCEHRSGEGRGACSECPSGEVLRTGSSRGKWDSPDRRDGSGASEHPSGGVLRKQGSILDEGEVGLGQCQLFGRKLNACKCGN